MTLLGALASGKQQSTMTMGRPVLAQCQQSAQGQRDEAVASPLSAAHMDQLPIGIDVAYLQLQHLAQTKAIL